MTFELKKGRKACGANIKTVDAAGASRDTLFDHFVLQELLEDFQVKFRAEGIPDNMYNTDHANDTECVTWCAMGGQMGPIPEKGGKRKAAAGGMRQRIEHLGGLQCIVAEKDEEATSRQSSSSYLRTVSMSSLMIYTASLTTSQSRACALSYQAGLRSRAITIRSTRTRRYDHHVNGLSGQTATRQIP